MLLKWENSAACDTNYKILHMSKSHTSPNHTQVQIQAQTTQKYNLLHQISKNPFLAFYLLCYIAALAPRVLCWTIFTGACHLFSSLSFLLHVKETNNLEHVHNTKKIVNQFLPSLYCLLCIFCTPMLIFSKGCINCIFTSPCNMS
jgi:hypothetical protein